jgi:hypothetical protein
VLPDQPQHALLQKLSDATNTYVCFACPAELLLCYNCQQRLSFGPNCAPSQAAQGSAFAILHDQNHACFEHAADRDDVAAEANSSSCLS